MDTTPPPSTQLLISTGNLTRQALAGQVAAVTGAGGGIGLEAARALAWLGARVVIAEIDPVRGQAAATRLCQEFGPLAACFIRTDVGDEGSVANLASQAGEIYGKVDILINNATINPLGGVTERPIADWDASYRVNLRGPVLLAQAFLPGMVARNYGVFMCISSVGGAYMGAYETFKAAQVELSRTLEAELEGTGVITFTIGPGIVPTETARVGVAYIAQRAGKTLEEFFADYKEVELSVEAAGAGFAAAAALAEQFRGLEIGSQQALIAAGIGGVEGQAAPGGSLSPEKAAQALALCQEVRATLAKEAGGWRQRPLFQRQWMLRDFKQHAGAPVEQALEELETLETRLAQNARDGLAGFAETAGRVRRYYQHYKALAKSATKDPRKLEEYLGVIAGWEESAAKLAELLGEPGE